MWRTNRCRRAILRGGGSMLTALLSGCLFDRRQPDGSPSSPTGTEVDVRLGPEDSGRTLTVGRGTRVRIELQENPSTGYEWRVTENEAGTVVENRFVEPTATDPGTPGERRLFLEVTSSGRFSMEYVRPWETPTAPERRFVVTFVEGSPERALDDARIPAPNRGDSA
jgi:predicted secreted protein